MACVAIKRSLELDPYHSPECGLKRQRTTALCSRFAASSIHGSFAEVPSSLCKLSKEDIDAYLKEEIRQLKRRKLISARRKLPIVSDPHDPPSPSSGSQSSDSDSESSGSKFRQSYMTSMSSSPVVAPATTSISKALDTQNDEPRFSLNQVQLICSRLLREQEEKLRAEYERVLETKLAEQYETFVHFTNDQIHRRFEDISLTYVS